MKSWQRRIIFRLLLAFNLLMLLQTGLLAECKAQTFTFPSKQKKGNVSFRFVKNLIIIPLQINGKGPFNFILDTGVNPLIITDPTIKDSLNVIGLRPIKISGFGEGDEVDAFYSNTTNVSISNASINSIPTVVLKEDLFNLSNHIGIKVHGLIGFNFFNSFIVKVNYVSKRIIFWTPKLKQQIKGEKIAIELLDNKPYITTKIETENGIISVKLIVDCGASHALSLEKFNAEAFPLPSKNISANLGIGISGLISGNVGRINKLWLGKYVFTDVLASFPNYNDAAKKTMQPTRNGNLGADVLKHFNVVYDYQNASMYLQKNENFSRPFEHDMSGIELYITSGDAQCVIGRIEKDSPAEIAGLLANDVITAINFKAIETYTLDEIGNLFKSDNGKTVLVEIYRGNRTYIKLLKLKKRI